MYVTSDLDIFGCRPWYSGKELEVKTTTKIVWRGAVIKQTVHGGRSFCWTKMGPLKYAKKIIFLRQINFGNHFFLHKFGEKPVR